MTKTNDKPAVPAETLNLSDPVAVQNARNEQQAEQARSAVSAKADAPDDKLTTVKTLKVLIFRNEFTSIPDVVFEHELPILQALHGAEMVKVIGDDSVEVANINATDELARLQRKYKSKEGDVVGAVFRNDPRQLAKDSGIEFGSGPARKPASSSQTKATKKVIGRKR